MPLRVESHASVCRSRITEKLRLSQSASGHCKPLPH